MQFPASPAHEKKRDINVYLHPLSLRSPPLSGKEVVKCYRHATAARERAKQVNDPVLKQYLIEKERRWLSRVHGDEFIGRLTEMRGDVQ